jgi:hypothetical protein
MNSRSRFQLVIPAKAGTHFDTNDIQMDSRVRGNDAY